MLCPVFSDVVVVVVGVDVVDVQAKAPLSTIDNSMSHCSGDEAMTHLLRILPGLPCSDCSMFVSYCLEMRLVSVVRMRISVFEAYSLVCDVSIRLAGNLALDADR